MAHILLFEVPGGNDFAVLDDALAEGHEVTFFTSDLGQYEAQGEAARVSLNQFRQVVAVSPFAYSALEARAREIHSVTPFDAIICLLDIRIIDASRLAEALGLRFLDSACATLARDKVGVRSVLEARGIRQPRFALAHSSDDLAEAVSAVGYPAIVKPADGYGSQNVAILRSEKDLDGLRRAMETSLLDPTDYGLGVRANNRFCVEQFIVGDLIGCDVFSAGGERVFLGVNDKLMYPPPSFAIRGSCFSSQRHDRAGVRAYAFAILDAMGFDFGAAHIEMIVAEDGPYLVEVNPRLVSAQIPFQMAYAFERSIYTDLINLHLGTPLSGLSEAQPRWFSAIRWLVADWSGVLEGIDLPEQFDPLVRRVVLFKQEGDAVCPPMSNGDRIGYIIAVGEEQGEAERVAERSVADCRVRLR